MSEPLRVSVIIPTSGRPDMLGDALRSVLSQERAPWEVIVVDDEGGRDARAVVAAVSTVGVPVRVVAGPGKGPGAARNLGVVTARGSLLAFLDDDDRWAPQKLARQIDWFGRWPELGALGTRATLARGNASASRREAAPALAVSRRALVRANRLVMSSVMARRECLEDVGGFDESLTLAQDWDLWLRTAEVGWGMAVLEEALVECRQHEGQRSANRAEMRRWECEVLRRAYTRGRLAGAAPVLRRRLAWAHARLGRLLVREGEVARGREELRRSMSLCAWNPLVWGAALRCLAARRAWASAGP